MKFIAVFLLFVASFTASAQAPVSYRPGDVIKFSVGLARPDNVMSAQMEAVSSDGKVVLIVAEFEKHNRAIVFFYVVPKNVYPDTYTIRTVRITTKVRTWEYKSPKDFPFQVFAIQEESR